MKSIRSAAVIGSGIMGSQIAAHLAGCGIRVLLLDIPSEDDRNGIAGKGKAALKKGKPSPLYTQDALELIETGNTEDDLARAAKSDWVIEAIVEQAEPKLALFQKLSKHMGPETIVSTNTSGIPLKILGKHFQKEQGGRFLGTHFFNPPRYLRLVELIPAPHTSPETIKRMDHVLSNVLNKVPVLAKDSPAFIANRIGVHAMVMTLRVAEESGLSVEEIDGLTGPLLGRPKTATFRLADLVGLDTLVHIIRNLDESFANEDFSVHPRLQALFEQKRFGRKTGQGFYAEKGAKALDLKTGEYREAKKARFEELKEIFKEEDLDKKLRKLFAARGRGAEAARILLCESIAYALKVADEVAHQASHVDEAMELGFGWERGPFRLLDAIGADNFLKVAKERGLDFPDWVSVPAEGGTEIYTLVDDGQLRMRQLSGTGRTAYEPRGFNLLLHRRRSRPMVATSDATLWDMGDDVLLLEFHSKMNSVGPITLDMIRRSIEKASESWRGLVIGNQGPHFCAGANIAMVLMDAANGEFDNVNSAIESFQGASMAIKFASVPVVVSPHSMTLGGGCEFVLHSQRPVLSPETYIGLVEVGVGLLPAGGGTKELTLRAMDRSQPGIPLNRLAEAFKLIAMAKVATSAQEARQWGLLDPRAVVANNESTRLDQAKQEVLALSRAGYRPPAEATAISVLGTEAIGALETAIYMMREAGFASEHDAFMARSIARVMAGGEVTPGTLVDERHLLDLEREEFLRLLGTRKSQERIEHMLKTGKPLRN